VVEQLAADYPNRFAPFTMHVNGDGFDLPWGQNRLDVFYGVAGAVPTFMVDALWNCQSDDYRYYVEQQLVQPTDMTIELSGNQVSGDKWDITARVCHEGGGSRPVRVFIAPTLDEHPDLPRYTTNVLMQKVFETDITISGGACQNVTNRITFDPVSMAYSQNIAVVAWAQQPATSAPTTVYQAGIMRWPFPAGSQLSTIEVSPVDVTLAVGGEIDFTAVGKDQNGDDYPLTNPTWSLGSGAGSGMLDPATGTTTTFTATTPGTRQILCTEGGVNGGALVTITDAPRLAAIVIDPASATVDVDGQVAFSATGTDQYGDDFPLTNPTWSLSGDGDGSFDPATGTTTTFTATYPGTATVSCTEGDVSAAAEITINGETPRLATITISGITGQIRVGDVVELTATGTDQYGKDRALSDPAWRVEGDGDGVFEPMTGAAVTSFTATTEGSAQIICSDEGIDGATNVEISRRALPAPRRVSGRVTP
jgi:hypothetical protein